LGNISKTISSNQANLLKNWKLWKKFGKIKFLKKFNKKLHFLISCLKLKEKSSSIYEYIIDKETTKNINYSCLAAYWQIGEDSPKNRILSYIITFLISDQIYNSLSLNGKLGYSEK